MTLYRRGKVWYYNFLANGQRHAGSTHSKNKSEAQGIEAAIRADALRGKHEFTGRAKNHIAFTTLCDQYLEWDGRIKSHGFEIHTASRNYLNFSDQLRYPK